MLNKGEIIKNFSQSARDYDKHALLQKALADELFSSVPKLNPQKILDIGCGTGYLARRLAGRFPQAEVVGMDIAPGMIKVASQRNRLENLAFVVDDGEELSFARHSFDLVVSNASLQWMDAEKVFGGAWKVLRPGGYFVFTTFGPRTLYELRESGFRVNRFKSIGELKNLLGRKFKFNRMESNIATQKFRSVRELVCHLKELGAQSLDRNLKPKQNVLQAFKEYKKNFGSIGYIIASYEVILGFLITLD